MELRHLKYFVAVAEELSFTKAAERLHIAQPPLSQQIVALEEELGLLLFTRTTRKTDLTQAGKEFLPEARAILESVNRLEQNAQLRKKGELGELSISTVSSLASRHFASTLRAFQKDNKGIKVALISNASIWQIQALRENKIDVGFLLLPPSYLQGFESWRFLKGSMKLAVPSNHPLAKKSQVEWKELANEPIILVEPEVIYQDYYREFLVRCRSAGFEPAVSQYSHNVATQIWLVSAGLGVAPVHFTPDAERATDVKFVSLPKDAPTFEASMVWRKNDPSPALEKFIRYVKNNY